MRKYNILVALFAVVFGLAIFWFSRNLTTANADGVPGEAFWPHLIAWLLIGLGVLQVIEVVAFPAINAARDVQFATPGHLWAYLSAFIAICAAALMVWAGFVIAALILMPLIMIIMGEKRPLVVGLTTVVAVGVIWFFFVHIFNITLPTLWFLE
ncbi:tripartite tricarboxylate transporter TctB family protein [Martelella sp. HB161492]|uniref:tripartite tricarboxylate transporter TctB family protein n=1 Tax=Martelella sp. HB161492 TaxID=2720726 RepID=UPI0015911BCF|nr:tripartite tricarboxylate transporter TctB family protein [Martelella sp. HB161492]